MEEIDYLEGLVNRIIQGKPVRDLPEAMGAVRSLGAEIERLRAENDDLRQRITLIPADKWDAFVRALDEKQPNEALKRLMREHGSSKTSV